MKTRIILSTIAFLMGGVTDGLWATQSQASTAESALVTPPDTPERVLNEMKGPPTVMQQELRRLLQPEIDRGDIVIRERKDRVEVNLAERALFDSGSDKIHAQGVDILMRVGSVVRAAPNWQTTVIGHADNQPIRPALQKRFANNQVLSEARAQNSSRLLMEGGVDPKLIKTAGSGDTQPIATNATAVGRSKNRRIELVIEPIHPIDPSVVAAQ